MSLSIEQRPLSEVDLSGPEEFVNGTPHELFARMRREAPIHFNEIEGDTPMWNVMRLRDQIQVLKDGATFASGRPVAFMHEKDSILPIEVMQQQMINMDAPRHTRLRKIVRGVFTPGAIKDFAPMLEDLSRELVDNICEKGECDFVDDLAVDLPIGAISAILGMPRSDWRKLYYWTNVIVSHQDPDVRQSQEQLFEVIGEMGEYLAALINDRLENPKDDIASRIAHAEVDGERLTMEDMMGFFVLLAVAGNETTRNSLTLGMRALMQFPQERETLIADPAHLRTAVDEVFRWVTPLHSFRRTATRDVVVGDQEIKEGDKVVVWLGSGNRDDTLIEDADVFRVTRPLNSYAHVALGDGPHKCLGQHLARMTITTMYRELLSRVPDMQPAGDVAFVKSNFIHGATTMPVTFTPSSANR